MSKNLYLVSQVQANYNNEEYPTTDADHIFDFTGFAQMEEFNMQKCGYLFVRQSRLPFNRIQPITLNEKYLTRFREILYRLSFFFFAVITISCFLVEYS